MPELIFVTGNSDKFTIGREICSEHGVTLSQEKLDIDEVQSEDISYIARKKAEAAYAIIQKPLLVRDDTWSFAGLRGFPGPYMKSMNHWFSEDDFLRLTRDLENRQATLTQTLVFIDGSTQKIFNHHTAAYLLKEVRGNSPSPSENVLTIEGDNGLSIAEVMAANLRHANRAPAAIWDNFIAWYKEYAK